MAIYTVQERKWTGELGKTECREGCRHTMEGAIELMNELKTTVEPGMGGHYFYIIRKEEIVYNSLKEED